MGAFDQFINTVTENAQKIGYGLAIAAVVFTGVVAIICGGREGMAKVKERLITIGIGIAILSFGVSFVSQFIN